MKFIPPNRRIGFRRDARGAILRLLVFRPFAQHLAIAVTAGALASCVMQLPPAPTPPAIPPPIQAAAPPASGQGRLVVDVVNGPTPVQRIRMDSKQLAVGGRPSFRFFETPELLCPASPCVTDVPGGNVLLGFPVLGDSDAMEVELVHVGTETSVYRRALSEYHDQTGSLRIFGIVFTAVGGSSAMTGIALLPIGLAKDNGGLTTAGAITLGGGIALLAFGIWAIRHDSPTYRPGSSNHFPLAPAGP
jgi:hypothetical protein